LRHQYTIIRKRITDSCSAELEPLTISSSLIRITCRVVPLHQKLLLDCFALNPALRFVGQKPKEGSFSAAKRWMVYLTDPLITRSWWLMD